MIGCIARAALLVVSQSDPCPGESVVALPNKPWKKAGGTTLSIDCRTETRDMSIVRQWRQRQRNGFADESDAISPEGRSPLHLSANKAVLSVSKRGRERERHYAKVSCCLQALVKLVKRGPILAWCLCSFFFPWTPCGRSAQVIIEGEGNTT